MRFIRGYKYAMFSGTLQIACGQQFLAPNYAQQDEKDKTRTQPLLIRRQNHCEMPELYLSKQQKYPQSARKKPSNRIFPFSSFHQLQKTGKNKTYFSVKSRQTKLRAFTAVRKPSDHTIPVFTWASPFHSSNVWCHFSPSLHHQRSSVSKTSLNHWQVCVQPLKTEERFVVQHCAHRALWLNKQHLRQQDTRKVCSPAPSLTLVEAWTRWLFEWVSCWSATERLSATNTAINRVMAH